MEINNDTIRIDTDYDIVMDSDQSFVNYPIRFPTVNFALHDTHPLNVIADAMRKELGYLPMFDDSGEHDEDGWYNFRIGINGCTDTRHYNHTDNYIEFSVESPNAADDYKTYTIDLTEDEQIEMYKVLNEQCIEKFGQSCDELLEEARKEMLEYEAYLDSHKEAI